MFGSVNVSAELSKMLLGIVCVMVIPEVVDVINLIIQDILFMEAEEKGYILFGKP